MGFTSVEWNVQGLTLLGRPSGERNFPKALRGRKIQVQNDEGTTGGRRSQLVKGDFVFWNNIIYFELQKLCLVKSWVFTAFKPVPCSMIRLILGTKHNSYFRIVEVYNINHKKLKFFVDEYLKKTLPMRRFCCWRHDFKSNIQNQE
jgi:hypothetical protein